jgi:hypothetical protein
MIMMQISLFALHTFLLLILNSAFTTRQHHFLTPSKLFWSRCVEIHESDRKERFSVIHFNTSITMKSNNITHDMSLPRDWLEWCEFYSGNGGAYTVVRCDYNLYRESFLIWGRDFHLNRLEESFKAILPTIVDDSLAIENAITASNYMVENIFKDAKETLNKTIQYQRSENKNEFLTLMITILWQPRDGLNDIKVCGHAFSTLKLIPTTNVTPPEPLVTAVALDEKQSLPNRFEHSPQSKLSSWCRRRRPLERNFKRSGVGEVFLTKTDDATGKTQLLEGLTSNIFVIYKGGTIRTASKDFVLDGYARSLVLKHVGRCGLKLEIGPIYLDDTSRWDEVFVSSSIKIIAPVKEILLPSEEIGFNGEEIKSLNSVWKDMRYSQSIDSTVDMSDNPKWKELLHEILKSEGYNLS